MSDSSGQAPEADMAGRLERLARRRLESEARRFALNVARDAFLGLSAADADGGPAIVVNTWERLAVRAAASLPPAHGEQLWERLRFESERRYGRALTGLNEPPNAARRLRGSGSS